MCRLTDKPRPVTRLLARLTLIRAHHLSVCEVRPCGVSAGSTIHLNSTHYKVPEIIIMKTLEDDLRTMTCQLCHGYIANYTVFHRLISAVQLALQLINR